MTAMNARGYDGNMRILEDLPPPKKTALVGIAIFDAALVISIFILLGTGVV
jgi:energy-coupling factor transporter transmembrane protein EcfT